MELLTPILAYITFDIYVICQRQIWHIWHLCHIWNMINDIWQKKTFINLGVKIPVSTSTMQPHSSKVVRSPLTKWSSFLCIFWHLLCIFQLLCAWWNQHQIKRNLRSMLFIYMVMTSTQKINNIDILRFVDQH
jgi:hypothetical protein